ncbi:MAG: mandelate racemase/muconate lactonizing enzyme family protein [Saprospiraceae bacterium]|nr:mandelate racemase/muconate lactonizing enzyme family protein [Saprospiraceae bacterium]
MPFKRRNFLQKLGLMSVLPATDLFLDQLPDTDAVTPINTREIKITGINCFTLEFDKITPLSWNAITKSGGSKPKVDFLELMTDVGIKGISVTKGPRSLVEKFAKKIRGLNLMEWEKVWHHMFYYDRKPVAKGLDLHAIGSVDMAVWDIIGKALNLPVHAVLGTFRTEIPAYAAGGYYEENKGISELVDEMETYAREGFQFVKMKVAGLPARQDAKRVRAVCQALGNDVRVMIDANNGYASAYEAIRFGRMVEDLDLYWFEEPVAPDDWRGNAEVKDELDIPVVAGENEYTRWGARDLIDNNCCDILNLDTIKAGGITEYKKIAALASAYHIPVAPHGTAHMNIHMVAALDNALILETYPLKARDFNPALPAFELKNGQVHAPMTPGLGMELADDFIKKYKIG